MKSPYIHELQPEQLVNGLFLVQYKDIRQKKSGEPYLSLMLSDRTGELEAKMWDNVAEVMNTFERDDFINVRGLLQVFQNRLQLTVHKIRPQPGDSVDLADFFPASKRNPDEMFAELQSLAASIGNAHLRALVESVINDPQYSRALRVAPAAKNIHHAYLGGLLEHVLSLCSLARQTAPHYHVDLDLVLTGAILHDIGKVHELTYDRAFGYSSDGQLLGHIVIGLRIIAEKLREMPDFPPALCKLVEHMIVSHHGYLEYGSPKLPAFPEALLLHHLDNMDSKMECMRAFIEKDRQVEGCWTGYNNTLERSVLKKDKYLEPPARRPEPEPVTVSGFADKLRNAWKP